MPNPDTASHGHDLKKPNAARSVKVSRSDLPLHCPLPGSTLWDSHPRVYIPIEDAPSKRMLCPYCSTEYRLEG